MSTFNKAALLFSTLESIFDQSSPFDYEVIVVNDGSTDNTHEVCNKFDIKYEYLRNDKYRNPSIARNIGYRMSKGHIIICQSDEVIHKNGNVIYQFGAKMQEEGRFIIATVFDVVDNRCISQYTGPQNRRPLFFLGAVKREDLYKVGGNDEDFVSPGFEDNWFSDCLIHGLGLEDVYDPDIVGWHQSHARPDNLSVLTEPSRALYEKKIRLALENKIEFKASGGSWKC